MAGSDQCRVNTAASSHWLGRPDISPFRGIWAKLNDLALNSVVAYQPGDVLGSTTWQRTGTMERRTCKGCGPCFRKRRNGPIQHQVC